MALAKLAPVSFFILSTLFSASSLSYDAVDIANEKIGKPYVWGAQGPVAFDCSGLTSYAYRHVGVQLSAGAVAQAGDGIRVISRNDSYYDEATGTWIPYADATGNITTGAANKFLSKLRRGDLVFFGNSRSKANNSEIGHVGIFVSGTTIINAYYDNPNVSGDGRVRYDDIATYDNPTWWRNLIIEARRLPSVPGPSTTFSVNDIVEVTADDKCIRDAASYWRCPSSPKTVAGVQGNVLERPMMYNGLWYWHVELESGADGWVAETYLQQAGVSPTMKVTFNGTVTYLGNPRSVVIPTNVYLGAPVSGAFSYKTALATSSRDDYGKVTYYWNTPGRLVASLNVGGKLLSAVNGDRVFVFPATKSIGGSPYDSGVAFQANNLNSNGQRVFTVSLSIDRKALRY